MSHGHLVGTGRFSFLCRFVVGHVAALRVLEKGELTMDWTTAISLLTASGLVIYLALALLMPEIFG
jgi:hypothetical protein